MTSNKRIKYSAMALVFSVIITVLLYIMALNTTGKYEKVQVQVVDIEVVTEKYLVKPNYLPDKQKYKITVAYKGKNYNLENVTTPSAYSKFQPMISAYYANGKMYANIEGIKSTTSQANIYFVGLGVTFILMVNLYYQILVVKREKQTSH